MLDPTTYQRAQHAARLVARGVSMRSACHIAGISRDTLRRYQRGEPMQSTQKIRYPYTGRAPRLCPTCRAMVFMPCLACQIREVRA